MRIKNRLIFFVLQKVFDCMNVNAYWLDEKNTILGCNQLYCNYLNIKSSTVLLNKSLSQIEADYDLQFKINNKRDTPLGCSYVKCYINKSHDRYFNVSQCTLFGFTLIIETNISEYIDTISRLNNEITELQNKEVQTNAYLNNVIRIVPASIYWKDLDLVIRGSNLFHTKLAGFSDPKEVIGKTEYDFVWKDQAAEILIHDQQIISEGKGTRLEEKATLSDGSVHTFLTSKEPLRDSNSKVIGIIGISIGVIVKSGVWPKYNQAAFLSDCSPTCTPSLNVTLLTTSVNRLNPLILIQRF